jgi:hypothetical protein
MTISRSKINTWVPWMCCQKPWLWLDTMLLECHADKSQPEAPRGPAIDPRPAAPGPGSISRVAHDDHDSDLPSWRCCGSRSGTAAPFSNMAGPLLPATTWSLHTFLHPSLSLFYMLIQAAAKWECVFCTLTFVVHIVHIMEICLHILWHIIAYSAFLVYNYIFCISSKITLVLLR